MEILDIKKELAGNAYPGRGIVIGKSACMRSSRISLWAAA